MTVAGNSKVILGQPLTWPRPASISACHSRAAVCTRHFPHNSPTSSSPTAVTLTLPSPVGGGEWPCWRGPHSDNISHEKGVPTRWDPADAVWKVTVPGVGHASPIVCGDLIITATALPEKRDRVLVCFDRITGNLLWQKTVVHGPLEKLHPENSHASGTPATDGKRLYAVFRVGDEIVVAAHDTASCLRLQS